MIFAAVPPSSQFSRATYVLAAYYGKLELTPLYLAPGISFRY